MIDVAELLADEPRDSRGRVRRRFRPLTASAAELALARQLSRLPNED